MGVVQDVKEKFSVQDAATIAALGALGGAITSRFVQIISPTGGILAGAVYGSAIYSGQLLAGNELTPTRSMIATAIAIGVSGFALFKGGAALAVRFGYEVIPTTAKGLAAIATTNFLGNALVVYFPVIFPSFRTVPTLPDNFKDLCSMPQTKVYACHYYYEGNPQVFSELPSHQRFGLEQGFKKAGLPAVSSSAYDFKAWDEETITYVQENDLRFESSKETAHFQNRCYELGLDATESVAEEFPLPNAPGDVATLSPKQRLWYKRLFEMHPSVWENLSPAFQVAFRDLDKEFTGRVRLPRDVPEVNALSDEGIRMFHRRFSTDTYEDETVLLTMIGHFSRLSLSLPSGFDEKLEKLPQPTEAPKVTALNDMTVHLYSIKYNKPTNLHLWSALPKKVQWAFIAKPGHTWPEADLPSGGEILTMSPELLQYYHSNARFNLLTDPDTRYVLCKKFYENDKTPTPEMISFAASYVQSQEATFSPFVDHLRSTDIDGLTPNKLRWFAGLFQSHRAAWTRLNLDIQVEFKKKPGFEFLHYTYPTTVEQVTRLSPAAVKALQDVFDINIMNSTGPFALATWSRKQTNKTNALDDQRPELFRLGRPVRTAILRELAVRFDPDTMPESLQPYKTPPATVRIINGLETKAIDYWGRYYTAHTSDWEKLSLSHQLAYRRRIGVQTPKFPPLSLIAKDAELEALAIEGNRKAGLAPPDNVALADNAELQTLLFIADDALFSDKVQGEFHLAPWVQFSYATQAALLPAFGHANIQHHIPGTGGAQDVPQHPLAGGVVVVLNADLQTAYYNHFSPAVFSLGADGNANPNFIAVLNDFRANFQARPNGLIHTIKQEPKSIDELSDSDRTWARRVFSDGHGGMDDTGGGQAAWGALSLGAQLIYKEACSAVDGGLPAVYALKAASLQAANELNDAQLTLLHTHYKNNQEHWISLDLAVRQALSMRFKKAGLALFEEPWRMTVEKAQAIQPAERAAYAAFFNANDWAWDCLDSATQQQVINSGVGTTQVLDLAKDWKTVEWNRFYYGYNRILNLKNTAYTTVTTGLIASEYFGLTPIVSAGLSLLGSACVIPYVCY